VAEAGLLAGFILYETFKPYLNHALNAEKMYPSFELVMIKHCSKNWL